MFIEGGMLLPFISTNRFDRFKNPFGWNMRNHPKLENLYISRTKSWPMAPTQLKSKV